MRFFTTFGPSLLSGFILLGCGESATTTASGSAAAASGSAKVAASGSAAAPAGSTKTASKPKPAVKAKAKAELDNKKPPAAPAHPAGSATPEAGSAAASAAPEAPPGEIVAVPGTDGQFLAPNGWKIMHGKDAGMSDGWILAGSADGKAAITATAYAKGEDPTAKLGEISTAAKLTECTWNDAQDAKIGLDEFPAKVSDGVCLDSDGNWNYMMYAMVEGGDLNVFFFMGADVDSPENTQDELALAIATIHKKK